MRPPPIPARIAAALAPLPPRLREKLLALRALIFAVADETPAIGALSETLKWNEPAYLPLAARTGTTIRINAHKGASDLYALYVPCQTSLLAEFRDLYPGAFRSEGERALLFGVTARVPVRALKHCIALALTYHARKRG